MDKELEPGVQSVINDVNNGKMTTKYQSEGKPTLLFNTNTIYSDEKGEQWRKENDYGGTLWERASSQAMDVYRNLFSDDAVKMRDAKKIGEELRISPQFLMDNQEALEEARRIHREAVQWSFLSGQPFSAENIDSMYPEIKTMRAADPVGAAQALQNYQDVHGTRNIFDSIHDTIFGTKDLLLDAYNSGSDMVKLYDAQMKAVKTGDVEAARPEVDEITQRLKEYHEQDEPTTPLGKVVYDTIQQLTIYGTQGLRALQYVPKGMAMAMAAAAPAAAAAGPETLGAGTAAILTGAGITGAAWGFRTGMFKEIQNQSMAERYWQMANAKDKNGKPIYSRNNMLLDSIGTGAINGAIELGLLELGYKPIKAAWGKDAAKAILTNGAAQRDIAEAGKGAITRIALTQGAMQYARGVASELAEEGAQSMVGSMAENIEYGIHGQGKWNTVGDVLNDAIDSMVQAVPAALGMGGMGAAAHTAGNYKAMNNIASIKLNEWKEEYKRNVEKQTIDQLIAQKKENSLAKEAPDVYQKVVDAQAKQVGMDTMYVDAQELARTEAGVNVLNDMVNKGIVSGEQVDNAVSNGTDLEIKTGVFAQLADETTDTQTLMDATTMNKGGVHMAALRERAKRIEAMRQELSQLANDKSDKLAEEIVQEHFKDADEPMQEAARDVVYRNPYDIEKSYKDAVKEARNEYENAVNYTYYSTYKPQGVSIVTADANGYNNTQTGRGYRMSENEPWYSDMYKEYGGKATKEQLLDVAYKNERKEIAASSPELLQEWENNVAEKKAKYETLKGMEEKFTALAKSDYAIRSAFTKNGASVYTQALHILSSASEKASQAAKENAFIYARMAERWTNIMNEYGDTAYTPQKFMEQHPIVVGNKKAGMYGQPITNMDIQLDKPAPVITIKEKYAGMDWKDLRKQLPGTVENDIVSKINEKGEYIPYVNEATGNKVIVNKDSVKHFKSNKTSSEDSEENRSNTTHYEMIEAIPDILKKGIWVEDHIDRHSKAKKISLVFSLVKINKNVYLVKITVKDLKNRFLVESGEYTSLKAYDVSNKKEPIFSSTSGNSSSKEQGSNQPLLNIDSSNVSIRELLKQVNDWQEHPYVNPDGTPNYGIYFGNNETGGVMYIMTKDTTYEQQLNGVKAAYDANTGAIHLFDAADQSSFIHEAGHMWLSEMKNMAMQEGAPEQLIKDLDVLTAWGTYSPEKMNDYAGTNREKEFAEYAKAIEDARKSGDAIAIKAAEERWMQERFARAFERYIADGKAPVRELQGPFRKFKKWLIGIYQDLKNLGKEPPEDVKRVMDRMLATDEEIETWAKLREINAWDRKGFSGDLSGSEGNMIKKWAEKIRETAKEKLMQKYMEDIKKQDEADRQRGLEEEKIAYQKQLCEENELYKYENLYNTMPEVRAGILAKLNIADEKEFRKAMQEAGGTLEERTHEYMKAKQEEYDALMYSPEQIRTMADEQLASTNGQIALNELEAHAMRRKLNSYIAECVKAMREVGNVSGTDAEVAAQLRNILHVEDIADKEKAAKGAMKDSILAKSKEIADLKKRLAETKEKGKETKEQNERTIAQLKAGLNEVIKGLNDARDMGSSNYQSVLRLTREEMNDMTVGDATTWRHYEIKAKSASRRADVQMSAGNFTEAIIEKNNAQKFYCMSRVAKENEDFLRKALGHDYEDAATGEERTGIAGIINRIKRQKNPVRMGPNERYFIEHLAYILGLDNRDGRMPLDDKGNPIGINWEYLYRDLSPDNATEQKSKLNPDDLIAPWVRAMVERKDRIEDYQKNIAMAQMKDIYQAIQAIYRVGKRDYEATTLMNDGKTVSIIDAVTEMLAERDYSVDTIEQKLWSAEQEENDKTAAGRLKDTLSDALLSLTKPEIVLNDMGKSFIKYIYKPIDTASRNEMSMLQQAYKEFGEIYNMYSKTEWRHIRQDKLYNLGRISNYTKEQVMAIALNWGNKEGRQRILDNLNEGIQHEYEKYTQTDVENLFAKVLTEKDLDFLEAVWKQIDQYWPERNKVQERLYGVGLGRVQATPYTINGRKVSGGYYPIVYDPKISTRTTDMELDDIVKSQLSGNAAMSIGMGSTKKRVKVVKGQVVMKSLNIWPQAVNEAIHHICMREAVTDVYKLLNRKEMEAVIVQDYGIETYQMLKQWARDCWKTDIAKTDKISRMLETLRRNTTYSVMAYRASTAILNGLNIFPMMREIGFANTWRALKDVYITGNYKKNRQFVMEHSPFMAERINTLDKDFRQHMTFDVDKNASIISVKSNGVGNKVQYIGGIKDGINRFAYLAIAETDLMLSMPLWKWQYEESLRRQIEEGKTDELVMRDQATFEADRAVRNVLGSGMTKDQAQVQRTQGLVSQIIPFYSYCSTVMNALIQEGYNISAGKSKVGMWNAMLYWIVLPTIFEQLFRSTVAGDDWETLMKKMGVKMITNTTQGIPVVRDAVEFAANAAFDLPNYDSGNVLAISIIDELQKGIQSAGSKNQDATDVGRHLTRALNRYTGFSDTLTDGFWSLMRFSLIDTDRSILDLVNSVIFDRRYKIAKEREKAEKQKEKKNTKQKDDKK